MNLALNGLPDFLALPGTPGPQHRATMHICPSIDYVERAWDDAKYGRPSAEPAARDDRARPCTIRRSRPPAGTSWASSCSTRRTRLRDATWDDLREPFADRVLDVIAEYAPEHPRHRRDRQVLTPLDLERRFGITGGNIFHGEMSLDQMFVMRPVAGWARYQTPIRGLYLCGSGSAPRRRRHGRARLQRRPRNS